MDRIFGYSGAEWTDMPSRALYFDDETHNRTGAELQLALQQGRSYRCQLPMHRKDGSTVWIDASDCLLPDSSGRH
jgi:PAS domain S-box-containing protein